LRETGGGASGDADAGGGHSESADILLRLEQDDVDLGSEEAAQHHRPTQTDRDAHGGCLHLGNEREMRISQILLSDTLKCLFAFMSQKSTHTYLVWQKYEAPHNFTLVPVLMYKHSSRINIDIVIDISLVISSVCFPIKQIRLWQGQGSKQPER